MTQEIRDALQHAKQCKRNVGAISGTAMPDGSYILGIWLQGSEPYREFTLTWAEFREAYKAWQFGRRRMRIPRKFERVA